LKDSNADIGIDTSSGNLEGQTHIILYNDISNLVLYNWNIRLMENEFLRIQEQVNQNKNNFEWFDSFMGSGGPKNPFD